MLTVAAALFVLSLLIIIHEWGHFLAARLCGVRVLRFSIGFGPRIFGKTVGETDFCVSAVPLGGYVKLLGEGEEEVPPEWRHRAFSTRPLWQRALIVAAGPVFNFLLAWLVFTLFFVVKGRPLLLPEVGKVLPESPAARAGLKPGDRILSVDGVRVRTWEELTRAVRKHTERPLLLVLKRGDRTLRIRLRPEVKETRNIFGETIRVPVIGIVASGRFETERVAPWSAVWEGLARTLSLIKLTLVAIVKLVERVLPLSSLGGPLLIAQMAGQQAREGFLALLLFAGILSVNLGVINLLPIPMLDGGHLVFYAVEAVRGRPLSPKTQERIQKVGLALLITLMVLVFYNDLVRLFPRWVPRIPHP
ncbi:RIP metalloprotease RseP [Thermosulfurimonas sp. F29]|uniref:RIP metalloprotease RseP n=1 Tax=Thermosulfurimonas sp. F29 TaxID=2867247 RepID=UPI001C8321C8|nr:RIP metalloprotease RseP [Thermosulfurimonas sp. F29]MBX6423494.1 RIP metalloprotease RseP [Thermosulfurimonas sp. F29]